MYACVSVCVCDGGGGICFALTANGIPGVSAPLHGMEVYT